MDLTNQNFIDPTSEIDSCPQIVLDFTKLSPIDLYDPVGTALYGYFGSQSYLNENNIVSYGNVDLTSNDNATLLNPNLITPSLTLISSENSSSDAEEPTSINAIWQSKYPENELSPEEELTSPTNSMFDGSSHANTQQTSIPNFVSNDNAEAQIATQQEIIDGEKVYPRPACSFSYLIALALKNCLTGELTAREIYSFILEHFPYYRTASHDWKSSVRHNLSKSSNFKKIEEIACSTGNTWTIDPTKVDKIDRMVQELSRKHSLSIKQAMLHPELLESLESSEIKFVDDGETLRQSMADSICDESSHDVDALDGEFNYTSECLLVPAAKRQKTLTGVVQDDCLEEVTRRRKTPLTYLMTNTAVELSLDDDGPIDLSIQDYHETSREIICHVLYRNIMIVLILDIMMPSTPEVDMWHL